MKILLTNDDGINAEGLQSMYAAFMNRHETYVIAPDSERSACSNIFTMREPVHVKKIDSNVYSVNGYPADCVSLGLHSGIIPCVDLVISGINHGPNLGDDIHFSGTVAGARTAMIFGTPGIAVSVDTYHRPSAYFADICDFLLEFISSNSFNCDFFYNINYPDLPAEKIKGARYSFLSKRYYIDRYNIKNGGSDNEFSCTLDGKIDTRDEENSDSDAVKKGFISVTPVSIDCTCYSQLPGIDKKYG